MSFTPRFAASFIALFVLACIGAVAGWNIVRQGSDAAVSDMPASIVTTDIDQPQRMPVQEPFIAAPSASSTSAAPSPTTSKGEDDGITAWAYLVGDIKTGKIYISLRPTSALPVASISKLVTAIVATETMSPTTTVAIASTTYIASLPIDTSLIHGGESFSLSEILKPLLLSSSNVAAEAIASTSGRGRFLELMTSVSWEISMPKTFFADPSGLDPNNVASAKDIFSLARYLYEYHPDLLAITRIQNAGIGTSTDHAAHLFASTHPFNADPRFVGGKTGRTPEAGETMLTILNIGGDPIAFIVLHSDYGMRKADTEVLIQRFTTGAL